MSDSLEPKTNEEATSVQAETEATESVSSEGTQPVNKEEAPLVIEEASEPVNTEEVTPDNSETAVPVDADGIQPKKKSKKPLIFILSGVAAVGIIVGIILIIVMNAKSAEAKRVDDMISSIGTVTLDSESKIAEAEKAVKALAEEDRNQLDNVGELENARKTYEELSAKAESERIEKLIDAIGEVTTNSERSITAARNAYDEAEEPIRKKVTNYNKLTSAESKYSEAVDASYAKEAQSVITLINGIGTVTENSEKKISEAEKSYKDLSPKAKEKVTNYTKLTEARKEYNKIKKQILKGRLENALSNLTKETDSVTGYSWYYSKNKPQYVNQRVYLLPHIGNTHKNDDWYLCMTTNYYGDDWIFYESLIINADGQRFDKQLDYSKIDRSVNKGQVAEFGTFVLKDSDIVWLRAIAKSDTAVVRFQGDHHQYDLTISESDKESIKQVLDIYDIAKEYKEIKL